MTSQNLGDVFGPAAAGKGGTSNLAGRLTRVAAPPVQPIAPPVAEPVASGQAGTATSYDATKQISVYVLPHVPQAIRAAKRGRTNAAVVYDAIESCLPKLPTLLAARRATPAPQGGGLFVRQTADIHNDDSRIPWTFKVTKANRAVLDRLVERLGTASRSELVATALEHTYPPPTGPIQSGQ